MLGGGCEEAALAALRFVMNEERGIVCLLFVFVHGMCVSLCACVALWAYKTWIHGSNYSIQVQDCVPSQETIFTKIMLETHCSVGLLAQQRPRVCMYQPTQDLMEKTGS